MQLYVTYLRAYALARSRSPIPVDELPKGTANAPKLGELVAFALGVGDGPSKDAPDMLGKVCDRVAAALAADARAILLVREAEERVRAAQLTASPTVGTVSAGR